MAKISAFDIDQLRMPEPGFGDPRGRVDRDVLRAASWGTDYDIDARRNAIAGAMAGPAPGGGGGGAISPEQAYINAIGFPGTLDQFYASRGMTGAQGVQGAAGAPGAPGAAGAPGASGMPTGGGMTPEQAYLAAIGWRGSEEDFYRSRGMLGGGGVPTPTGIMPAPQLLPQYGGGGFAGSGFAGDMTGGFTGNVPTSPGGY